MALCVDVQPYGAPAFGALERAVGDGKGGDPLAPVTVVVGRGALGLSVRRRMAAAPDGVGNVRFVLWNRLAAELAADWVARSAAQPVTGALVHEAVRAALAAASGRLGAARDQPGTVRAVARTYRELAAAPAPALGALGRQGPQAASMVALVEAVRARLDGYYDDPVLFGQAAGAVRLDASVGARLGPVVVYLPPRLGAAEEELAVALAAATPVTVVVGTTGDAAADAPGQALVDRLVRAGATLDEPVNKAVGAPAPPASPVSPAAPRTQSGWPSTAWLMPNADTEVLVALRRLLERSATTPLERMALLYPDSAPYPSLVRELVRQAGVPAHGPASRTLAATVSGRILLGVLSLADDGWRREQVVAWWSSGPVRHDGRLVPAAEWDVLSCDAGVVAGIDQWQQRLGVHAARLRRGAARARAGAFGGIGGDGYDDVDGADRAVRLERDAARCDALARFVTETATAVSVDTGTWAGWASWAEGFLATVLGGPAQRADWPLDEIAAADAVVAALGGLGALDRVGALPPTRADFRMALAGELEARAPETTRSGQGLLCAPVADAVGLDLDVVAVVGMVDGVFPAAASDDVLVPDRLRERADPAIPLRGGGPAEARRDVLAAMAGAREAIVSCSVGDQRTGRALRPARLFLDAVGRQAGGVRVYAGDLAPGARTTLPATVGTVASYAAAVSGPGEPISASDWVLRSILRWTMAGRRAEDHFLVGEDPVLGGALAARHGRRSQRFTRFDGRVRGAPVPSPATGPVQSATGLETYARCPRRYLFGHVLGVAPRERPEAVLELSALERGSLVHAILERLVAAELDTLSPPSPPSPPDAAARLEAVAASVFAEWEASGLTGIPALWALERARAVADLREFLRDDARYRRAMGARPIAVEDRFGWGDDCGLSVPIGGGRAVRLRGRIDRVDRVDPSARDRNDEGSDGTGPDGEAGTPTGEQLVVIDYKTGTPFTLGAGGDPVEGGTRLQLPIYALAAAERHGTAARPVAAGYWFVAKRAMPDIADVTDETIDRLVAVVSGIADAVVSGTFPANPGDADERGAAETGSNCGLCPYDRLCPPDRLRAWTRKQADEGVGPYLALSAAPSLDAP